MSRSKSAWSDDLDREMNAEFFSEAEGISSITDVSFSELDLSDEEKSEQTVSVKFDADGFAYEASDEETEGSKPSRTKEIESEPLEPMGQPQKIGATQWGQDFAETIARVSEFAEVSKLNACRWEHHGTGKKISCKPSVWII